MVPQHDPPPGWPTPRRSAGRVLSVAGFGLLTLTTVAIVVADAAAGQVTEAVIWAVAALLFAHLTGLSISLLRRPARSTAPAATGVTDQGERGLAFAYARRPYYWLTAVLILVTLFAVELTIVFARLGAVFGWVLAVVFAACGLFLLWFLVVLLRLAPGMVVLTPTGVYHRSLALEHFVPWDAVVDVLAREGPTPWITVKALPTTGTRERKHTGRLGPGAEGLPFMIIRTYWLGANAVPAYEALRHYFEQPGERPNLTVAVDRRGTVP